MEKGEFLHCVTYLTDMSFAITVTITETDRHTDHARSKDA